MGNLIDRAGQFRAQITEYGIKQQDSGSVCVQVKARLTAMLTPDGEWEDWRPFEVDAYGDIYIVKKDGTPNESGVKSLAANANWDGNVMSIQDGTWVPSPCQVAIGEDSYKDQVRYRIEFVNDYDRVPGQMSTVTPEKAKELQARYGAGLRAIAGNAKRNSKPTPPPTPPAPPVMSGANSKPDDDIPF